MPNFYTKQKTLTFLVQICPKRKLGFEIQKINVAMRISIFEIPCVTIFRQNRQPSIFGPKFAQKWILRSQFQKSKSGFEIKILEILGAPIFRQNGHFEFLVPNLPENGFWGGNFKNLSLDSKSTRPVYHVCQFSVKMDNF